MEGGGALEEMRSRRSSAFEKRPWRPLLSALRSVALHLGRRRPSASAHVEVRPRQRTALGGNPPPRRLAHGASRSVCDLPIVTDFQNTTKRGKRSPPPCSWPTHGDLAKLELLLRRPLLWRGTQRRRRAERGREHLGGQHTASLGIAGRHREGLRQAFRRGAVGPLRPRWMHVRGCAMSAG